MGIFISIFAPYYVIYSATCTDPTGRNSKQVIAFDFNADERPYVDIIRDWIHDVFSDHFSLGPEMGNVLVPDVKAEGSRLYDLVFSEDW